MGEIHYPYGTPVDEMSGAAIGVSYEHHEVHEGDAFKVWQFVPGTIGNNEWIEIAFYSPAVTVPRQRRAHLVISANAGVQSILELHRISGVIGGGVPFDATGEPINRRDDQPKQSDFQLVNGAVKVLVGTTAVPITVASVDELCHAEQFGSRASGGGAQGARDQAEIVLNPDQKYRLRLTSNANGNVAYIALNWYEHTDTVPI